MVWYTKLNMTDVDEPDVQETPKPSRFKKVIPTLLILIIVIAGVFLVLTLRSNGPVPKSIQKSASFKVYYPKQSKMPMGYHLDTASFKSAESGVVLYSVSYGSGRSMVFSETAKPSSDIVDKFNSSAIPVHTQISTPYGKALIGAYGEGKSLRTIASLPITNGPWLIVTAPSDINQEDLSKVLGALTK